MGLPNLVMTCSQGFSRNWTTDTQADFRLWQLVDCPVTDPAIRVDRSGLLCSAASAEASLRRDRQCAPMAHADGASVHDFLRGLGPHLHCQLRLGLAGCHDGRKGRCWAGPRAAVRIRGGPARTERRPRNRRRGWLDWRGLPSLIENGWV